MKVLQTICVKVEIEAFTPNVTEKKILQRVTNALENCTYYINGNLLDDNGEEYARVSKIEII